MTLGLPIQQLREVLGTSKSPSDVAADLNGKLVEVTYKAPDSVKDDNRHELRFRLW